MGQLQSIPNIAELQITPLAKGIGTVGLFVESTNPITGQALLAQVQATADASTAAGIAVFVEAPSHLFLVGEIELVTSGDLSLVESQVRDKVRNYVNSLRRGETLVYNQIISAILQVENVSDARFKTMERGMYDISTQTVTYKQTIRPVNHPAAVTEKWVTADEYISLC